MNILLHPWHLLAPCFSMRVKHVLFHHHAGSWVLKLEWGGEGMELRGCGVGSTS